MNEVLMKKDEKEKGREGEGGAYGRDVREADDRAVRVGVRRRQEEVREAAEDEERRVRVRARATRRASVRSIQRVIDFRNQHTPRNGREQEKTR